MKHLITIQKTVERLASRLNLGVETIAGFADGTYRVELKERDEVRPTIGFISNDPGKAGSDNAGKARSQSAKGAKE